MPSAEQIAAILARRVGIRVDGVRPVAGGDINLAYRAETSDGPLFIKTRPGAPAGSFRQVAAGLIWLGEPEDGPPTAEVVLVHDPAAGADDPEFAPDDPRFVALRWIEHGPWTPLGEERFGRALAHLHARDSPPYGFTRVMRPSGDLANHPAPDALWLGDVSLPAGACLSFAEFWGQRRILPLAAQAKLVGAFSDDDIRLVERLAARIGDLVPSEPSSRTHGDLWSGNALPDASGTVHLIDPIAHGSHREVDLATLRVFGGPSERCFAAYREIFPLADGHEERVPLMQLGIILVHVVLFGGSYVKLARRIAQRYV